MKTLCVTGHRPAKLPWKYKKEGPEYDEYCESLGCYIDDCIRHGYTHFISGMALGVDMDFAETVLDFKAQYGFHISLECATVNDVGIEHLVILSERIHVLFHVIVSLLFR